MHIKGIDYIELYVGNVLHAAHFYLTTFGFTQVARVGLETGERERVSTVLRQNEINLVLTGALHLEGPVAEHISRHGDSVKDIAFAVDDAAGAYAEAVGNGATPVLEPTAYEWDRARLVKATIAAYGDTVHSFVERSGGGWFLPGYRAVERPPATPPAGLTAIDHVAICVEPSSLEHWIGFYARVLGFRQSHHEDVATEYSAMNSKVVQDDAGRVKFPIMEPAAGKRKSQIEEYLSFHHGPGAQHIALLTDDIVRTARALRRNGIEFLDTPDTYYDVLEDRVGKLEGLAELRELDILVDRDQWGLLMQVFTKPLHGRPTVFMEIMQRRGARGFGGANIRALFEAIERDQALRGNL